MYAFQKGGNGVRFGGCVQFTNWRRMLGAAAYTGLSSELLSPPTSTFAGLESLGNHVSKPKITLKSLFQA